MKPISFAKRSGRATAAFGEDLGGDGDGGFIGGVGVEVQAERAFHASQLIVGDTGRAQARDAFAMCAPGAERR